MKCQGCGAKIAEGKLYCEACGKEIQIVPDFDPEVEQRISQTMDHILEDVFHHKGQKRKPEPDSKQEKKLMEQVSLSKKHYFRWIVLLICCSILILFTVVGYMNFSADYQIGRGNYFAERQNYASALKHYKRAGELSPDSAEVLLYIAECYEQLGNIASVEAYLTDVIRMEEATDGQLGLAYKRLAFIYLEKNEYQKIDSLLKNCNNETVMKIFGQYRALPPQFSHEEGTYTAIVPLKLQGSKSGKVYYTVDGSEPTVESKEYTSPVFLYNGEYTIKAIYVNEYGVVSDVVTKKYRIIF